jgi:2-octaprenyl-6-methoxyphenol hydroxylase
VWQEIASEAQPVTSMLITDSRTRDVVRPVFLTFADDEPTSHVVPDGIVVAALYERAQQAGVRILAPNAVSDFATEGARITARLRGSERISAPLLVAADGVRSRLRAFAGIATVGRAYGQSGIVATVDHERPHGGQAIEHFLPAGPFAILPLKDRADGTHRSSLVWTEPAEVAERLVAGDALVFRVELERRFGHRLGTITVADTPRAFPLTVSIARTFVKPRFALVGDAAHSIHPIAGQGLNLGYRDVAALAETIVDAHRLGLDIGSAAVLDRYQRWRRFDTTEMALATDVLNRLFANDNPAVRIIRDVGLGIVDRLPGLKNFFMAEASGTGEGSPRLLRGEAL